MLVKENQLLDAARVCMSAAADAIRRSSDQLDHNFMQAVDTILNHSGKVVVAGIGKSGQIAKKISATLSSTGTPAVFLHAAEAVHGDLGIYTPGDPTIMISKSGSTAELVRLVPLLRQFQSPLISILGNLDSPLARKSDIVLNGQVKCEADPLGLVPTTSSVVALALGDALAASLMKGRNFTSQDFARYHPAGQLGRNLLLTVEDIMHDRDKIAVANPDMPLREIVIVMTHYPLGAACVFNEANQFVGIITDGDIRRALKSYDDLNMITASSIMSHSPVVIHHRATLQEAIKLMEERESKISVLPVINPDDHQCLGLLRLHDIYQH